MTDNPEKAVEWFQAALGVEDWGVKLSVCDDPPDFAGDNLESGCCGVCQSDRDAKIARIWVSPARCKRNDFEVLDVLMHELLHMAFTDAGMDSDDKPPFHAVVNRLEAVLAAAYKARKAK